METCSSLSKMEPQGLVKHQEVSASNEVTSELKGQEHVSLAPHCTAGEEDGQLQDVHHHNEFQDEH